jgi:hypothetical protein
MPVTCEEVVCRQKRRSVARNVGTSTYGLKRLRPVVTTCKSAATHSQVVPLAELEAETLAWCREMLRNSPTALRLLKAALNAAEDGHAGIQVRSAADKEVGLSHGASADHAAHQVTSVDCVISCCCIGTDL